MGLRRQMVTCYSAADPDQRTELTGLRAWGSLSVIHQANARVALGYQVSQTIRQTRRVTMMH